MKFLSYNSSSMSSSSSSCTSSFDANNICSSKSATAAGCLAGILRRMLCSRSLPTHPTSDNITEASSIACDKIQEFECKEKVQEKFVPSVVARLMGLESMPNMVTSATPSLITRSRSMNSMDFKGNNGDDDHVNGEHRRVKSTLSLREMPTFLELENEEFFVLSFENGSENKEKRFKGKKCEMGNGELKQRSGEKCKSNESEAKVTEKKKKNKKKLLSRRASDHKAAVQGVGISPVKVENSTTTCEESLPFVGLEFGECSTPKCHKEVSDGAKMSNNKKKKKVKSLEHVCISEESSPVSVLDFDQFIIDHEVPTSELDSDSVESNSRRKLSPEPENYECQSRRRRKDNNLIIPVDRKTQKTEGKCVGSRKKYCNNQNYLDMCDQICKTAEAELVESNWLNKLKHEEFEDICAEFESQILDQSLGELVHQFIRLEVTI